MRNVVTTYDVAILGHKHYFVCNEMNCLAMFNDENEEFELIDSIPEESILSERLVSRIITLDSSLVLIPLNAHKIWLYDLDKINWRGIEIKDGDIEYKFMSAVHMGNRIYLLPCKYKELLILNTQNYEVEYIDISLQNKKFDVLFRSSIVVKDDHIYAACCSDDYILKIDMTLNTYQWIHIDGGSSGFSGIAYNGKLFFISPRNNSRNIYSWKENEPVRKIELAVEDKGSIRGIVADEKEITVFRDDCLITVIECDFNNLTITKEADVFCKIEGEISNRMSFDGNYTCKVDGMYKSVEFVLSKKDTDNFINQRANKLPQERIYVESGMFNLSNFINYLKRDN